MNYPDFVARELSVSEPPERGARRAGQKCCEEFDQCGSKCCSIGMSEGEVAEMLGSSERALRRWRGRLGDEVSFFVRDRTASEVVGGQWRWASGMSLGSVQRIWAAHRL